MPTHTHILYTIDLDCQPQSPKRSQGKQFRYNAVVVRVIEACVLGNGVASAFLGTHTSHHLISPQIHLPPHLKSPKRPPPLDFSPLKKPIIKILFGKWLTHTLLVVRYNHSTNEVNRNGIIK